MFPGEKSQDTWSYLGTATLILHERVSQHFINGGDGDLMQCQQSRRVSSLSFLLLSDFFLIYLQAGIGCYPGMPWACVPIVFGVMPQTQTVTFAFWVTAVFSIFFSSELFCNGRLVSFQISAWKVWSVNCWIRNAKHDGHKIVRYSCRNLLEHAEWLTLAVSVWTGVALHAVTWAGIRIVAGTTQHAFPPCHQYCSSHFHPLFQGQLCCQPVFIAFSS